MIRLHLTLESFQSVRFLEGPLPVVELLGALCRLRRDARPAGHFPVRLRPPRPIRPLFDLFSARGEVPDFLVSRRAEIGSALDDLAALPADRVRADLAATFRLKRPAGWLHDLASGSDEARTALVKAVDEGYRGLVEPQWAEIVATAQADLAQRGHIMLRQGVARAIGSVSAGIGQLGNVVEIGSPADRDLPAPHGLDFVPSCLAPETVVIPGGSGEPVTVVYPIPGVSARSGPGRSSGDGLSALVGARRAAILRAAVVPRGTTELAVQAGVSLSSASEHASALRNAGLIMTVRAGRKVLHTATELGASLVRASDARLCDAR
ncbi:winged helix-turn-helix domain-containing protein [Amycolatopsis sp. NPDC004079]|uniref:winged helix-turn-helix domain-containing protein n=1 Tax=Amycolatopsis sp. NPDC004079 TaxID=3154549 RepID=UPI0033BE0C4D